MSPESTHKLMGFYIENTRHYTLVHVFSFFKLLPIGCIELRTVQQGLSRYHWQIVILDRQCCTLTSRICFSLLRASTWTNNKIIRLVFSTVFQLKHPFVLMESCDFIGGIWVGNLSRQQSRCGCLLEKDICLRLCIREFRSRPFTCIPAISVWWTGIGQSHSEQHATLPGGSEERFQSQRAWILDYV